MTDSSPTLTIQSILYSNAPEAVIRAAQSIASSAVLARDAGVLGDWTLTLGDCSDAGILGEDSQDAIRHCVASAGGQFRYVGFAENLGHGGGHNRLAPEATGSLLFILNPDAVIAPDTLARMVPLMADGVGAVDGRQIPFEHPKEYDEETGETAWASGACLMTTASAFDEVGGFDHETFFMYCDDVDYSWRVRLAGYRVLHAPEVRVFHDKRLSNDGGLEAGDAEVYYSAESALLLPYKYSRSDVVARVRHAIRNAGTEPGLRALAEFERRKTEGTLPERLDPRHTVGTFVRGNYAKHRY